MSTESAVPGRVTALRSGNRIVLEPTTPAVVAAVSGVLEYSARIPLAGRARSDAVREGRSTFYSERRQLYAFDHKQRLWTPLGNWEAVRDAARKAGIAIDMKTVSAPPRPEAYVPHWDLLKERGFSFRYRQLEAVKLFAKFPNGRIDAPTGMGKGFVLSVGCCLFPKAKIGVAVKSLDVATQRLYPELKSYLPAVGIITGSKKVRDKRVTVYSAASLHHAPPDLDFLFFDECHEAGADTFSEALARFNHARMFGFSASHDLRADGLDARVQAIFGPVRFRMTYPEAVEHGLVVPIEVRWTDYKPDGDPCQGILAGDTTEQARHGIWRHHARNAAIAADVRKHPDDQVLIPVSSIEHGLHLKRLLPEYELVYRQDGIDERDMAAYRSEGIVPDDFRPMTAERRATLTAAYEDGRLKKAIATQVWRVGVNFKQLAVLARADAGGSKINDRQIPGRTSRIFEGKGSAIIYDYPDRWHRGAGNRAFGRHGSYEFMGWKQRYGPLGPPQRVAGFDGWDDEEDYA